MAAYFLVAFAVELLVIKKFNKLQTVFLWAPHEVVKGSKCKVSWKKICTPTEYGRPGFKDMQAPSWALRLCWEWFRWDDKERPWKGTATPCDLSPKLFPHALLSPSGMVKLLVSGQIDGSVVCFPALLRQSFLFLPGGNRSRTKKHWQMEDGCAGYEGLTLLSKLMLLWISRSLFKEWTWLMAGTRLVGTWQQMACIQLAQHMPCNFVAEGKVKYLFRLFIQNRNWTADRLKERGWPHDDACCLCHQQLETAAHLTLHCPYAKEVWMHFIVALGGSAAAGKFHIDQPVVGKG